MKKWIGILTALFLALGTATAFADHIRPADAKEIKNKEARNEFNKGASELLKHNYREAAQHFQRVEQLEPNLPAVHVDLAMALAAEGQQDVAKKEFDRAANLIAKSEQTGTQPQG